MDELELLVEILAGGGLALLPTETVYGLHTALSAGEPGLERIRVAKGSPASRPFLLLAPDEQTAFSLWSRVPDIARDLARRAWPGPLTLVGPAGDGLPAGLLGEARHDGLVVPTVSVRVPGDPWLRLVLSTLAEPLVSTSANRAGAPPPVDFGDVDVEGLDPDVVIDRGRCAGGTPSTLLSVVSGQPELIRPGAWPWPPE
jgi:L-threonylcarbamoyladenylate synthase